MPKTTAYIKDMDSELWRKFVGLCKIEGVTVATKLGTYIKGELAAKNL